jgi:hypothetical protein
MSAWRPQPQGPATFGHPGAPHRPARRRGGIAGVGGMHEDITQNTLQSQATRTYGLKMFAARDEDDIDANRGQPCTKIAADTASTKDCDAHGNILAS